MPKKKAVIMPSTTKVLKQVGLQIKLARLRRRITAQIVADRAMISRATLSKVEKGSPSVAIGIYANVLHALNGMENDLLLIAKDDVLGQKLQDIGLVSPKRVRGGKYAK